MITCTFEDGKTGKLRHVTVSLFIFNKDKTKILLVLRSGKFSEPLKWSPPGGFLSRDESTVEAAPREAREESGYKVNNLSLLRINDNPNRPKEDRQNVDFIYIGEASEKIGDHDKEIENIQWFDIDKIPQAHLFAFDHFENMQLCLAYISGKVKIPVIGKITA